MLLVTYVIYCIKADTVKEKRYCVMVVCYNVRCNQIALYMYGVYIIINSIYKTII